MARTINGEVLRIDSNIGPRRPTIDGVDDPEDILWLGELYGRYSDEVRSVVAHLAGPLVDAEDLVHEVFLAAHRKIRLLRRYDELGGWFHLAALREVWNVRRRARRWHHLTLGLFREPRPDDTEFKRRELAEWVYAVLEKLPERQREALVLFHLQGFTSVEIGRLVNCSEETVRARIFHGKRAFVRAVTREQRRERRLLKGPP